MSFFRVFPAPDPPVPLSELELRAQSHAEANSLTLAMHGWLRMMPWLKYTSRNERLLSAALRKRQAGVCRACLHALVLNYSRKHERQPLVTDHGRRSRLLGAWCTWMRATLDTKQRQHVFKCLQMRASSRRMSQTTATRMAMTHESRKYWCAPFVAWRELIRRRRRLLRLCKDVTKRYTSSIVADKFHWWVHAYLNWLHLRESVGNLFHRVSFRLSSHAFLEWTALIQENHRLLMLGTKALLRWEIFLMRQGFMALAVHGRDARKVMTAFKLVSARRQKNRIRSSFRRLKDQASQRVRLRAMHVRALNLWMRSIRTKFLLRWWDKVHDAHRITNALSKKKSLHMTGRLLSGSMDEWRMIAVQNRKHEGWATSKSRLHVRRALHDVLKIWHMHMYGQRTFNRVAGRISHLNKMHLRKRVFEAWRSDFGKRKHNLLTVSRALARRHFGAIRHYLDVWCGETQRMKRMKRICVDHVHCTGARKVMECFFQWRAHTTAQKRLIVAAAKIITRRDFVRVAGYFYFLARLTIKWKQISIWCDKMERSTTRWAFCLWCDERLRCMQKDRKWQYTAAKMMQGLVKRLFHHWRSSHVETKLDKRIVKKIAMRIGAYASIAPHVQHWRSLIKRRNMLNRTLRLKRLREKPALTNRYFKMWNDRTEYRRMVWSVSRRIKIRWFAMVGTQAFYVWRRHLSTRANEKALLHNMAIHRHFHFCAGFFAAWEEHVREGKRIELTRSRAEEHDKTTKLSDMQERLLAAEKLAHSAAEEKTALADELATAREERAAAYRVIEALNASEQGSKSRIENLVSRLDEASYMYDRLEEMQGLVKELQTLRRTSTDEINHLQMECDLSKAERESIASELQQTRDRLNVAKRELENNEREQEMHKSQVEDLSSVLSRHCGTLQWNLDKVDQVLTITKEAYERAVTMNTAALEVHDRRDREIKDLNTSLATFKREKEEMSLRLSVLQDSLASEKQRSLGLILPPADEGNKESMMLVLDMDMQDIKAKELDFVDEVAAHVSNALDVHEAGWVSVSSLQSGSIKARVWFGPGPSSNGLLPTDAINLIQMQAQRPGSKLLSGDLGSKVKCVELPSNHGIFNGSSAQKVKAEKQVDNLLAHTSAVAQQIVGEEETSIGIARKGTVRATRSANIRAGDRARPSRTAQPTAEAPLLPDEVDLITTVGGVVRCTIKLGLDFRVTGTAGSEQRSLFENNLAQDFSHATGFPPYCFDIKNVAPGSVVVDFEVRSSPSVPSPLLIASDLQKQISDPASKLRNGATTRYATSLTAEHDPNVLSGSGDIVKPCTTSSLRQSASSSYPPSRTSIASETGGVNMTFQTMRESDAIELLANDRAMRERIYALECLMAEKDTVIQELETNSKSAKMLREDIRELQRILEEKDLHNNALKSYIQELESYTAEGNSSAAPSTVPGTSVAPDHGLLPTHRHETSSAAVPSFGGQNLVQKSDSSGPVRTSPPGAAPGTRAETEQLLQFQSTLRKAEAALAEQSTIVEAQQQSIEAAEEQNKLLQEKLEKSLADLAEQTQIAESVTAQLEKLSGKNAELTKEMSALQKRAEDEAQTSERLRKELKSTGPSISDVEWELGAQKKRADEFQRRLEDMKTELARSMEMRRQQHEEAVLERQKLEAEKKSAVERQQVVIDRLMKINDKNRARLNSIPAQHGDEQMESLSLRAAAAENAVQESMAMYQTLKMEILRQEQDKNTLKQALDASLGGDAARAHALIAGRTDTVPITTEAHQRELRESILLMRAKTRWECLSKAQDVMLKRRSSKLVDMTFSFWAQLIDEVALEKHLQQSSQQGLSKDTPAMAPGPVPASSTQELSLDMPSVTIERRQTPAVTRSATMSPPPKSAPPSPLIHPSTPQSPTPPPRRTDSHFAPRSGGSGKSSPPSGSKSAKTSPILAHQAVLAPLSAESSERTLDLPRSAIVSQEQPADQKLAAPHTLSSQVLQLVGLKLRTEFPPYVVDHGKHLVDVFGVQQGDADYSNQIVEEGDTLLFIDHDDVSVVGAKGIVQRLEGQAKTQVHLVFSSRRTSSLYRISVLRHAQGPQ